MDELLPPSPSFFPPSPPPQVDGNHHQQHQLLELASCEVPEQWLLGLGDVVMAPKCEDSSYLWPAGCLISPKSELSDLQSVRLSVPSQRMTQPPPVPATVAKAKRRGRKPGTRTESPTVSHVEAERQRRDKLNRRFCELRAAVPTVSRMDKASLLADAVNYIAELRARVARLEEESRHAATAATASRYGGAAPSLHYPDLPGTGSEVAVEVRMVVGREPAGAVLQVTTVDGLGTQHAPAQLMGALRSLQLRVQHACVSRVQGVTVQDVVVDVPPALQQDDSGAALRATLLQRLHETA